MATDHLTSVDEALPRILAHARPVSGQDTLELDACLGRVLAGDYRVPMDVPPADNSAVDGYALHHRDAIAGAMLPVSGRIAAGEASGELAPGTAVRIFTGAEIPRGADTVIMQEHVERQDKHITLSRATPAGNNIRPRGQDLAQGTVALHSGTRLRPQEIGLLASIGVAQVDVFRPLRVALLSTGDELVEPGMPLEPGQIYNTNRYTLKALLQQSGCRITLAETLKDSREATRRTLQQAARDTDLILTSGGVSVGEEDHVRQVLEQDGTLSLWRLAMKPGKPLAFGSFHGTPVLGLPGNPAAALVTFMMIALPWIRRCQGESGDALPRGEQLPAAFSHLKASPRREYLRARVEAGSAGPVVTCYPNQSSGMLSSACWAEGLAVVPENTTVNEGDTITYYSFRELMG
ncbi:MAG TPA: molybdopterin molybdenumtransferase MoeA [Marinobacter sp.]|nr:molybdopterin molybdenumtransferase MoeA [Marinobacter sp.]